MSILRRLTHFDGARVAARPLDRIENVRAAAQDLRRALLAGRPVPYYRSMELVRVPYPAKFGYLNGFGTLPPFLHLCNRLFVVQFHSDEGLKTLLVSPSDWEHQRATPFFRRLNAAMGPLARLGEEVVFRKISTVEQRLAQIGLAPEDVDYITYDHLHTQNLTRWLGAHGQKAIFPNAKLLVMRAEWECAQSLVPWQNQWYCPGGIDGVPADRVILLDHDVMLGEGVALVATRGHTEGNHSIVVHTPEGLKVTSENGVSLDAYAPQHSRIPGLAAYAKATGAEVVLNGNTLEYGVDQYISMVQEKAIAGPSPRDERVPNLAPSSESAGFWLFPRTAPTFRVGDLHFGTLQQRTTIRAAA